ncbi:MAG: NADP-dependent oxidoreductase [Rhodospirillales bacterium]|nr:MAG: NADP-dependent oxidoreductase [Rhodospirillales bacterium]
MTATTNREWILASRPTGMVGPEHFTLRETPVPAPGPGELLVRVKLLSLDPANRAWMAPNPTYKAPVLPGDVMHGFALGEVVAANAAGFATGDLVDGMLGWRDFAVMKAADVTKRDRRHRPEHLMGVLGVTGLTAYHGLLDIGRPKPGETVLVSAAAGAVGSIVGQIAKIKGCRVVGTAGGPEKCAWLTGGLGFDAAVDYKAGGVRRALKAACPDGIDVYFDNTGGEVLNAALFLMNERGRIVCCGNLSQYNAEKPEPGPAAVPGLLVVRRLRMEGFIVLDYADRQAEAEAALAGWLADGRLKAAEDVVDGLENAPRALAELFQGRNRGKLLVRVA